MRLLKLVTVTFGLFVVFTVVMAIVSFHARDTSGRGPAPAPDLWTHSHRPAWAAAESDTSVVATFEQENMPRINAAGFTAVVRVGIRPNVVWFEEHVWETVPVKARQDELRKWAGYFQAKGTGGTVEFHTATNEHQLATFSLVQAGSK